MKKGKEQKLLEALRTQEPWGLEAAINRYAPYVAGVIKRVLGNLGTQEDLEELSSDVFVALWRQAPSLREDTSLKLWLGVVARNRALKHLRPLGAAPPFEGASLLPEGDGPSSLWERREDAQQVREAVLGLEAVDRDIFLRHYFWGQGVRQIAQEMDMNESTVKSRLKRGREKLRAILKKEDA